MIRFATIAVIACLFQAVARDGGGAPTGFQEGPCADTLALIMSDAARANVPLAPLENKIREGIAKKRSAPEILAAVRARKARLEHLCEISGGSLPKEYTKLLFAAERKDTLAPMSSPATAQGAGSAEKHRSSLKKAPPVRPQTAPPIKSKQEGVKKELPADPSLKHKHQSDVKKQFQALEGKPEKMTEHADLKAGKIAAKADKMAKKADKIAEKAAKKAEKKEKAIEKQMKKNKHH